MNRIVDTCPLTEFQGGLNLLHEANDDSHMAGIYSDLSTHTRTHPFNGPFSKITQVSRCQKGKTNLGFTEARDSEW